MNLIFCLFVQRVDRGTCINQKRTKNCIDVRSTLLQKFSVLFSVDLRNESNIFSVDRGINQKRAENCINARSALLQKFSILFSVDTSINRKNIRFISYHLFFNAFRDGKHFCKPLLNNGLF